MDVSGDETAASKLRPAAITGTKRFAVLTGRYRSFAYSALASFKTETSASASFQREKILILRLGFRRVALQRIGAGETEMGKSADGIQRDDAMGDNLLEFACGLVAVIRRQIRLATHINGIQAGRNPNS